jgi:hypothetical protein
MGYVGINNCIRIKVLVLKLNSIEHDHTYYAICKYIYITQFKDQVIILNTKEDKYANFLQSFAALLLNVVHNKELSESDEGNLHTLINAKIIECQDSPYPFYTNCKEDSVGVSNIDWRLPLNDQEVSFGPSVIMALLRLMQVNFYIKILGFHRTIQLINRARKKNVEYIIPKDAELEELTSNKACLIYPSRTKCLEFAMTYVLLALQREWKCNLEIGVQNYPFMAHAWVECNGKVIIDSPDLREGLGIILNEPFRRKQI